MGKIIVHRKAHRRRSFVQRRENKMVRVGPAIVKSSVFKAKDRGKAGRTPKTKQWSKKIKLKPLHKISGYGTKKPMKPRRRTLVNEVTQRGGGKSGTRSTFRTLNMIRNLNPSRKADKVLKKDANWLGRRYDFKIK